MMEYIKLLKEIPNTGRALGKSQRKVRLQTYAPYSRYFVFFEKKIDVRSHLGANDSIADYIDLQVREENFMLLFVQINVNATQPHPLSRFSTPSAFPVYTF